jgi:hypothetical protein
MAFPCSLESFAVVDFANSKRSDLEDFVFRLADSGSTVVVVAVATCKSFTVIRPIGPCLPLG